MMLGSSCRISSLIFWLASGVNSSTGHCIGVQGNAVDVRSPDRLLYTEEHTDVDEVYARRPRLVYSRVEGWAGLGGGSGYVLGAKRVTGPGKGVWWW